VVVCWFIIFDFNQQPFRFHIQDFASSSSTCFVLLFGHDHTNASSATQNDWAYYSATLSKNLAIPYQLVNFERLNNKR
jgi:hypothetical protein